MSSIASGLFIFISISILSEKQNNNNTIKYLDGSFSLFAFIISSLFLIGYFFRSPLIFGSKIISAALPASICFWLLNITFFRKLELKYWTFKWVEKNSSEFILIKSFLPFVILLVIVQALLASIFTNESNNPTLSITLVLLIIIPLVVLLVVKISSIIGVDLRKEGDPAVVLPDIKMPRMDGIELLRNIRSDIKWKKIPVVILTSSSEEQDLIITYEFGVNAYIVKPADFNQFLKAVKEIGVYRALLNELPPERSQ
jgi:CheY-like chemotaxis protein